MKEPLISFETAKLAFEKGYPVFNNFSKSNFYNRRTKNLIYFGRTGQQTKEHLYGAPTQSLLQKWLREVYKIHVEVKTYSCSMPEEFTYSVSILLKSYGSWIEIDSYLNYEEALEKGLQEALKILR